MTGAREARAVADTLIQQVPYRDKLTELLEQHRAIYDDVHYGCLCGEYGSALIHKGNEWHAAHLAKVIRGHLRTRPVVWAGPPSDARLRGGQS